MQLPVVSDGQMIGQDLVADEDEAVFAEIAVARSDSRYTRSDSDRDRRRCARKAASSAASSIFSKSSPPCVPTGRARSEDETAIARSQRCDGKIGTRLLSQDFRNAASLESRQQIRHRIARGALDLAGIVDGGLAEPVDEIGDHRQHGFGLIGVGDQIDDESTSCLSDFGVVLAVVEQRQRVGVVARHP